MFGRKFRSEFPTPKKKKLILTFICAVIFRETVSSSLDRNLLDFYFRAHLKTLVYSFQLKIKIQLNNELLCL